ncbi:hypothetical protein Asp14428_41770 [Actinoplanes sp. NBRC 14428]|nr:hypothetical protein Asp14428_41770 [Actinoplanes sp. NBRC 14428]
MPDQDTGDAPALPVWRRRRSGPADEPSGATDYSDVPLQCGGPELTPAETEAYLAAKEERLKREREEAEAREREEAEARRAARHSSAAAQDVNDEDEDKVAERYRNDRYSVKLLRQQDDVWGGGGADTGMLG